MSRFSPTTEAILQSNGWYPGRHVEQSWFDSTVELLRDRYEFELFPAAASILDEFGGLHIVQNSEKSPITNKHRFTFDFDPLYLSTHAMESFAPYGYLFEYVWGQKLGRRVYPIGNIDPKMYDFITLVDETGNIYLCSVEIPGYHVADTIDEALENLINGNTGRWMEEMEDKPFEALEERAYEEKCRRDARRADDGI